jgi:uncharacterized protein (DUF1330 family)
VRPRVARQGDTTRTRLLKPYQGSVWAFWPMSHKVLAEMGNDGKIGMSLRICAAFTLMLAGIMIGLGSPAWAQTSERPGLLLVVGKSTDRARIASYAASLPTIYASHQAYYLSIGGSGRGVTWLEGPWKDRSIIFAKFQSRSDVDAFWWGEPYRAAIRKRDNAGVFSVVALESTVQTFPEGPEAGYLIIMTALQDDQLRSRAASERATAALADGVRETGGIMLTGSQAGGFTALEGDTLFHQISIAAWPSKSGRDAYLASRAGKAAARLRHRSGLSAVATADGVPRSQLPPATADQR